MNGIDILAGAAVAGISSDKSKNMVLLAEVAVYGQRCFENNVPLTQIERLTMGTSK